MTPLAFMDIGFGEMVVVAFVALLLFGGRLPEMMRKFGASYREFKRGLEDVTKNPLSGIKPPASSLPYKPTLSSFFESKPPASAGPTSFPPMPPPVRDPAFASPPAPPAPPAAPPPSPSPAPASRAPVDDAPLV